MTVDIEGDKELQSILDELSGKVAERVASAAMSGGLIVLRREMKKQAPVGKTGLLKKSIGSRNEKNKRTGIRTAKAGINVGRTRQTTTRAPHGHLVALGTTERETKTGANRGSVTGNSFIRQAQSAAKGQLQAAMVARAKKALAKEVQKAAKGKR